MAPPEPSTSPGIPALTRAADVVTLTFAGTPPLTGTRTVAAEVPVQVLFGGVPFGIMMATPADLEDFAYGFSLTEGVVGASGEIRDVRIEAAEGAIRLAIEVVGPRLQAHLARRRAMTGRTSCGLCGVEDLAALPRALGLAGAPPRIALRAIGQALGALHTGQNLNAVTRAVHGAAWATLAGNLCDVREDVGRHNALDKLIGACLRAGRDPASGFIVVTSRASFEMVEKAAAFGCRTLVAISAPTALAIERARSLDVTLAGIARRDSVTMFHGADRILVDAV